MSHDKDVDFLIIGGGFYGIALALFLRSISKEICLVEAEQDLMTRASRVNQARVHTGFHYPRNALTAVKSMLLHQRFARDFPEAIVDNFDMLYAIPKMRSKVSARRFFRMFNNMGAPIRHANPTRAALFSTKTIEAAFECDEFAFDYSVLRDVMRGRLDRAGISPVLGTKVTSLKSSADGVLAELSDGSSVHAKYAFNVTYAGLNQFTSQLETDPAALKFELAEIALIEPPAELHGLGVTVMDGPFFSTMPYPSEKLYSLTHVRYTPHNAWVGKSDLALGSAGRDKGEFKSNARHMIADSARFIPAMSEAQVHKSLFEIKAVLQKNERDDGRPILFQRDRASPRVISIMGGKIDNIYDLFELIRRSEKDWAAANEAFVVAGREQT